MAKEKTQHYNIPRNNMAQSSTLEDIIRSGPLWYKGERKIVPIPGALSEVNELDPNSRSWKGIFFVPFFQGFIMTEVEHERGRVLKEFAEILSSPVMEFGIEHLLPGLGMIPKTLLHTYLDDQFFPAEDQAWRFAQAFKKQHSWLVSYVDVIFMEFKKGNTWAIGDKGRPRLLLKVEDKSGGKTTYDLFGEPANFKLDVLLGQRQWNETNQMFWKAFYEPVVQKYGGSKVTAEIAKKEMDAMNKEPLVQHAPRVAKRQLEWLAPMISLYRQLPHFNKWIEGLEAAAAGDFGRLPIPGDL